MSSSSLGTLVTQEPSTVFCSCMSNGETGNETDPPSPTYTTRPQVRVAFNANSLAFSAPEQSRATWNPKPPSFTLSRHSSSSSSAVHTDLFTTPSSSAMLHLSLTKSTPVTSQPRRLARRLTDSPTGPSPVTNTESRALTLAFTRASHAVPTPQAARAP